MKQLHVKNHFVARSYLKNWQDNNGKIWVYRTLVNHPNVPLWKPATVAGVAFQHHLYTRVGSGTGSDEIETWFGSPFG